MSLRRPRFWTASATVKPMMPPTTPPTMPPEIQPTVDAPPPSGSL